MKDDPLHLDSLVDVLPEASLVLCTRTDQIVKANRCARALLKLGEGAPPPFLSLLGGEIGEFLVFVDEAVTLGEAWTRRVVLRVNGSRKLRCELRARPVLNRPDHLLLLIIDLDEADRRSHMAEVDRLQRAGMNEWQKAEGFFADLERRNQLILNAAGEGIYGLNAEGKATFVNRAAQEMLGWTTEDLLGKDIHSIIHHHHLSGEPYHHHDCPIYKSFRFEQVNRIEDEVFWGKDGKPIRVEYISTPIYDHNILAGAVVIFRDITERKENEQKLRNALQEIAELRDRLEQENAYLQETISSDREHHSIIGKSPSIIEIVERIDLVAKTEANVLITGEAGTGKALIAAEIHKGSAHARRSLIHFKCSSVAPEEVEAELFGQVRGGPKGRSRDKAGKLELAHGGTLYLDGIEDLPADIQGKLLASLKNSTVTRLGDTREKPLELRVIASTALPADEVPRCERVRLDLYFFLNVFPIVSLPLRDRPEDISFLAIHLLKIACRKLNRSVPQISDTVLHQLQSYAWPGNVRELRNVMERAAIVTRGRTLEVELANGAYENPDLNQAIKTDAQMQSLHRSNLVAALRVARGKVSGPKGAASILDMRPTTVHSRIKSFKIEETDWR
ncbi:MAG: sigma 54-interacting transcriptional regulator [Pseudomonadota bacterium]